MKVGLFTRQDVIKGAQSRPPSADSAEKFFTPERLHQLGLEGVNDLNPDAITKHMQPSGSPTPLVYVLGEAPGENEDEAGEPFVGKAGRTMKNAIPDDMLKRTRFDNVCRTRPPNNRTPEYLEIECYRPSVEASIEAAKPKLILGVGNIPMSWALGSVGKVSAVRGRYFPIKVRSHTCWYYQTYHPSYVNRMENSKDGKIPGNEIARFFQWDVTEAYDLAERLPDAVIVDSVDSLPVERYFQGSIDPVIKFIKEILAKNLVTAIDIETNALRPYGVSPKILSVAIATQDRSVAFALDHPQSGWTDEQQFQLWQCLLYYIVGDSPKIAHNLSVELEWFCKQYSIFNVLRKGKNWHCSLAQAYVLDTREGGKSLNFLSTQYFGLKLKEQSKMTVAGRFFGLSTEEEKTIDRKELERAPVDQVLKYNGLDSLFTVWLYYKQKDRIKEQGLMEVYKDQCRRIPSAVTAQYKGLPVMSANVEAHQVRLGAEIKVIREKIAKCESVISYERIYGAFSPTSDGQVMKMFRDHLKRKEGQGKKKYSVDEDALSLMYDEPVAELIVRLRKVSKNKSTYVDPLDPKSEKRVIYPDRRVHAQFNSTKVDTRRWSCNDPNLQNYPSRESPEIRDVHGDETGEEVLLKTDLGQIEARTIAMASKDPVLVKYLWEGKDIHMDWALRINEVWPETCKKRHGGFDKVALKAFRSEVKNEMVFPAFYGSEDAPIADALEMPLKLYRPIHEAFWKRHAAVEIWQQAVYEFYNKYGYVELLTGFRRYGPLNDNMKINTISQGTASDLLTDAWNRLNIRSLKEEDLNLSPNINVHDDLSFMIKKTLVKSYIPIIAKEIVTMTFNFVNVPIVTEVAYGPDWNHLETVGVYTSADGGTVCHTK